MALRLHGFLALRLSISSMMRTCIHKVFLDQFLRPTVAPVASAISVVPAELPTFSSFRK